MPSLANPLSVVLLLLALAGASGVLAKWDRVQCETYASHYCHDRRPQSRVVPNAHDCRDDVIKQRCAADDTRFCRFYGQAYCHATFVGAKEAKCRRDIDIVCPNF